MSRENSSCLTEHLCHSLLPLFCSLKRRQTHRTLRAPFMCLVLWAWADVTSLFPSCSLSPVRLNPSCTVAAILSPRVRSWVKCEPVFPGSLAESKKGEKKKKIKDKKEKKMIPVLALYKVRLGNLRLLRVQPSRGAGTGKKCLSISWNTHCLHETLRLTFMNNITLWAGEKLKKRWSRKSQCPAGSTPVKGAGRGDFEVFSSKPE